MSEKNVLSGGPVPSLPLPSPRGLYSLRVRVLLLLAILFVAMLSLIGYLAAQRRQDSIRNAMDRVSTTAQLAAEQQNDVIAYTQQYLGLLSDRREVRELAATSTCPEFLASRLKRERRFANIAVIARNGDVICSAVPTTESINIRDRDYFAKAFTTTDPVIGGAILGRVSGKWSLPFVIALRDGAGQVQNLFLVTLDLEWVSNQLERGKYPSDARLGLIDDRGLVVARYPDKEKWVGRDASQSAFFKMLKAHGGEGIAEAPGFEGVQRYFGLTHFTETVAGPIYLWVGIGKESVLKTVDRQFAWTVFGALILLVLSFGTIWKGGDRLVLQRISAISDAARRLGDGDAAARTGVAYTKDELGQFARSFDQMAESLASTNRILRANRALRVLTALNQALVHAPDEQKLLDQMCRSIAEAGGFRFAWIGYAVHDAEKSVRPMASWGADAEYLANLRISWTESEHGYGPTGQAIRSGAPVVTRNAQTDPAYAAWRNDAIRYRYASSIALPLKINGDVLGTLNIYAAEPDAFSDDVTALLSQGAADLSFGIASQRAKAELGLADERIRESARYARSLIEASLDPLVTISPQGKITDVNAATEQVTGLARARLIGTDFADYFTDPRRARTGYQEVLREGVVRDYELTVRGRPGEAPVDVLYNATVYRNEAGVLQGVFAAARDVTERKQYEKRLRATSLYARSLIEASLDPLVTISAEGKITDVNEATVKVTGAPREDLIGTDFATYFAEPDMARIGYREAFEKGFVVNYPLTVRHRNGRLIDVLYNASVYRDDGGAVQGVFAAARDVTERKRAEAAVRELNATLEQRVRERTAELEAANKELEAFAYSVSHDLRAPLRSIDGFSKILEEDYAGRVDDEGKDSLHRVRAAAQKMGHLIDDLLKLSRLSRTEMTREAVDLGALARSVAEDLKASDPARTVTFDMPAKIAAWGDRNLLKVLLENLLGNAWKFTSKHASARIALGTAERDGEPAFFVRDDGAGFDMTHVNNLFTPFQRLHGMGEFPGTGIGLATVRRIVQRHGGRTWAEGAVEKGATFYFTLAGREIEAPAQEREAALA